MKHLWILSGCLFALVVCPALRYDVASALSSGDPLEVLAGRWTGEYHLDGKTTYISVTFKIEKAGVSGDMIAPLEDVA